MMKKKKNAGKRSIAAQHCGGWRGTAFELET